MKTILAMALSTCALLSAAAVPASAQEGAQDDLAERIANNPIPDAFEIYGLQPAPSVRADDSVQFGRSVRIQATDSGGEAWRIGINSRLTKPVAAGDTLLIAFWARLERGEDGSDAATVNAQAQLSREPYTTLFSRELTAGPEWQLLQLRGRADRDYAAGELAATLHLATGRHTLDIGPIAVLNMGQ